MKLVIIRHAEPDYKHDSLTERGFEEAELLSEVLKTREVGAFYCSPLGRAQATARPTLEKMGRTAQTLDWLQEFRGKVIDPETGKPRICWDLLPGTWTRERDHYDRDRWMKTPTMQNSNVEECYREVCRGLDELLARHGYRREENFYRVERENRETVVLFCHFAVEAVMLSHLLGTSPMIFWHSFVALPSSVTVLVTEEREQGIACFRCRRFGDVSHLLAAGKEPSSAAGFCETYSNFDERH